MDSSEVGLGCPDGKSNFQIERRGRLRRAFIWSMRDALLELRRGRGGEQGGVQGLHQSQARSSDVIPLSDIAV